MDCGEKDGALPTKDMNKMTVVTVVMKKQVTYDSENNSTTLLDREHSMQCRVTSASTATSVLGAMAMLKGKNWASEPQGQVHIVGDSVADPRSRTQSWHTHSSP